MLTVLTVACAHCCRPLLPIAVRSQVFAGLNHDTGQQMAVKVMQIMAGSNPRELQHVSSGRDLGWCGKQGAAWSDGRL